MIGIAERLGSQREVLHRTLDSFDFDLRCAAPGIITAFDAARQTVRVQLAITERLKINSAEFIAKHGSNVGSETIPELLDVPIVIPRSGGFCITMPIQVGDECLVIFGDTCIDSWWENGGVQDQMSLRRHDLSDGFAILGTWSQPRVIENYSEDALQIRTEDGETVIEMQDGVVSIVSEEVNLGGNTSLRSLIDERFKTLFDLHVHPDPVSGNTGAPTVPLDLDNCSTEKAKAL